MTQAASRFEPARSESLRLVAAPSDSPSADGAPSPGSGPRARGSGGGEGAHARAYTAALIARVQHACRGYKAGELAERMNLHPETVRRYLRGQKPAPEFLAGICRELGVSPRWLLLGEGEQIAPDA